MNEMSSERNEVEIKTIIRHAILDYLESETPVPPEVWTDISYELTEHIHDSIREWLDRNKTD